jgi:flagellar L-ring protein precursor FlgH
MNHVSGAMKSMGIVAMLLAAMGALPGSAAAKLKLKKQAGPASTGLAGYLSRMRSSASLGGPTTMGSLWNPQNNFVSFSTDYKARNAGDLVTILLSDQFDSTSNNTIKQQRTFGTSSAVTGLLGTVGARSRLQNLLAANSAVNLNGQGQLAVNSSLKTTLSGYVVEVLPNGILVVEAARDMNINNERQTILVRGLIRPGDLAADNSVPSSALSSLEVEVKGKGIVSDGSRQPNIVIRTLLRILAF